MRLPGNGHRHVKAHPGRAAVHHLVDLVDPADEFTVSQFQQAARAGPALASPPGATGPSWSGEPASTCGPWWTTSSFPGRYPEVARGPGVRSRDAGAAVARLHARLAPLDPVARRTHGAEQPPARRAGTRGDPRIGPSLLDVRARARSLSAEPVALIGVARRPGREVDRPDREPDGAVAGVRAAGRGAGPRRPTDRPLADGTPGPRLPRAARPRRTGTAARGLRRRRPPADPGLRPAPVGVVPPRPPHPLGRSRRGPGGRGQSGPSARTAAWRAPSKPARRRRQMGQWLRDASPGPCAEQARGGRERLPGCARPRPTSLRWTVATRCACSATGIRGVGADGVIRVGPGRHGAEVSMELRNADGSAAEMSGNGIRCLAQAAVDAGAVSPRHLHRGHGGRRQDGRLRARRTTRPGPGQRRHGAGASSARSDGTVGRSGAGPTGRRGQPPPGAAGPRADGRRPRHRARAPAPVRPGTRAGSTWSGSPSAR